MSEPIRDIKLIFPDFEVVTTIKKHLSPVIFTSIVAKLPLSTFAYRIGSDVLIKININRGGLPKITRLRRGDVYYSPVEDALGLCLSEDPVDTGRRVKIGEITSGINKLSLLRRITPVKLE